MQMKVFINDIIKVLGTECFSVYGNTDGVYVDNVADSTHTTPSTLDWVSHLKTNKQEIVENSVARVIIVDREITFTERLKSAHKVLIVTKNPKKAIMEVIRSFFVRKFEPGIDKSAYIHPKAVIGENNYIGPNCYIGDCVIGDNNVIHSNVCIYDRTIIGNNNVIHSGALLCVDGLGCLRDVDGRLDEFPQMGGVIIGNNCYIGGNTHVASGSLSNTIIENGCKINGLCFIGSNDHLHENVWITGSAMLAGSVEVGKNTTIFSKAVVRDWVSIGEKAIIGMGSVVTKDIPEGEIWVGSPAKKLEKK